MEETANEGSGACKVEEEGGPRRATRGTRGFSGQVNYPAVARVFALNLSLYNLLLISLITYHRCCYRISCYRNFLFFLFLFLLCRLN